LINQCVILSAKVVNEVKTWGFPKNYKKKDYFKVFLNYIIFDIKCNIIKCSG